MLPSLPPSILHVPPRREEDNAGSTRSRWRESHPTDDDDPPPIRNTLRDSSDSSERSASSGSWTSWSFLLMNPSSQYNVASSSPLNRHGESSLMVTENTQTKRGSDGDVTVKLSIGSSSSTEFALSDKFDNAYLSEWIKKEYCCLQSYRWDICTENTFTLISNRLEMSSHPSRLSRIAFNNSRFFFIVHLLFCVERTFAGLFVSMSIITNERLIWNPSILLVISHRYHLVQNRNESIDSINTKKWSQIGFVPTLFHAYRYSCGMSCIWWEVYNSEFKRGGGWEGGIGGKQEASCAM